ncbi:TPA: hypothetical protein QCZ27_005265 [Bacillus cereus]|jgi:hypothetical protein|nr:hypothetical protein [Bacillus cereus]
MARVSNELEGWKDIEDYEGKYQFSSLGRVKSLDRIVRHSGNHERIQQGKILKLTLNSVSGYLQVAGSVDVGLGFMIDANVNGHRNIQFTIAKAKHTM